MMSERGSFMLKRESSQMFKKDLCADADQDQSAAEFRFVFQELSETVADYNSQSGKACGDDADRCCSKGNVDAQDAKGHSYSHGINGSGYRQKKHCGKRRVCIGFVEIIPAGTFDHAAADNRQQ